MFGQIIKDVREEKERYRSPEWPGQKSANVEDLLQSPEETLFAIVST
jgi:hypothetical protein